jgi:spore coat protein U-like protein
VKKTIRNLVLAAAFAASPPLAGMAIAGTATGTFTVSATVLNNCSITTNNLVFGNYYASGTSTNSTSVGVNCGLLGVDILPAMTVSISAGNSGTPASRYMLQSTTHLNYNIYTTLGYSKGWGDGTSGSMTQSYNGLLSIGTIGFTGYGQLPAGQYVTQGGYNDTITVTVSF